MRRLTLLLVCILCATALPAQDNLLTEAEKRAGWRLLFDGSTYQGWENPARKSPPGAAWTIEDGCLKSVPKPRITEDLFTSDQFGDFELVFDWRLAPGSNSGVKYRIQDRVFLADIAVKRFEDLVNYSLQHAPIGRRPTGQEYVIGFEYQLIDNARHADARRGGRYQTAALYDIVAPSHEAPRPVGEFNHSRLVARGKHIEHWLNGEKVVDTNLDAPDVARESAARWGRGSPVYELLVEQPRRLCPLSLQNHGDPAWFRNIKIRPLN